MKTAELCLWGVVFRVEYTENDDGIDELNSIKIEDSQNIYFLLPDWVIEGIVRGLIEIQGEK